MRSTVDLMLNKRAGLSDWADDVFTQVEHFYDNNKEYIPAAAGVLGGGVLGYLLDKKNPWRGAAIGGVGGGALGAAITQVIINKNLKERLANLAQQTEKSFEHRRNVSMDHDRSIRRLERVFGLHSPVGDYMPPEALDRRSVRRALNIPTTDE